MKPARPPEPHGPAPGRELLYGRHAVLEMLRAGRRRVQRIFIGRGVRHSEILDEIAAAARRLGCPIMDAPPGLLESASANHQGVAAETGPYPFVDLDDLLAAGAPDAALSPLYLALDHVQDVQNVGALLRTAEAMAVAGVILPERRAAGITPAVVNASAGAVEHLRVAQVGNLVQALDRLKKAGVWVAGLDAGPDAVSIDEADLSGSLALVVGAEGDGLARLTREHCDWLIRIPMYGQVASLNVAVAGSVVLAAARRPAATGQTSRSFARMSTAI